MSNKVLLYSDGAVDGLAGTNTDDVLSWNGTDWVSAAGGAVTFAQEYFVATNGNDTTGDGSLSKPYATISKAVTVANSVAGDTFLKINVSPGSYSESFTISRRNILVQGAGCEPEEFYTKVLGTVTVDSTTCTEQFTQQIGLSGLFIQSSTTSPAVSFTGTGTVMLVIDDCYLYATNAAANVLLCESTAGTRSIAIIRNSILLQQSSSASATLAKFSYGDIRIESVRLYTSGASGTCHGIEVLNSATLLADRLLVDVTTTVAAILGSGSSTGIKLTLTNSAVTNRGANANSHALSVTNGTSPQVAAYLWQSLLSAFNASAKAVNGTAGQSLVYYGQLTFGPNASGVINTSIAAGVTQLALKVSLGDLAAPLTAANGGTGLGAPAAGDVGKVLTATALGTYTLSTAGGGGSGTVTSVGLTGGTSGIVIGGATSPITSSGTYDLNAPQRFQFDTSADFAPTTVGQLSWNAAEGTLNTLMVGGNVDAIVGQQLYQRAVNADSVTLTKGTVVYVFGSSGTRVTVKRALGDSDLTSATIIGVVAESIAQNAEGFVITNGLLKDLSVLPATSFTDGDVVYLSPSTPGGLTATKPVAPEHLVMVGYCVKASNGAAGVLLVHTQNGYELGELHDVYSSGEANGQTIIYNETTQRYENHTLTAGTGVSVTNGAGSITVGIGQTVGTGDSPTFVGATLTGLSANQYVKTDASDNLVSAETIPASDVTSLPYDIMQSTVGTYGNGEVVYRFVAKRAITLSSTAGDHSFKALVASTGSVTVLVKVGATTLLSVAFNASATGTVTVSSTVIAAGDEVTVVMPATADATLAGVYYTISGSL
jgi:hypothetical protein